MLWWQVPVDLVVWSWWGGSRLNVGSATIFRLIIEYLGLQRGSHTLYFDLRHGRTVYDTNPYFLSPLNRL